MTSKSGSGCGSVGRAVASNTRGSQFETSHRQKLLNICVLPSVNSIEKTKSKEKRPGMAHLKEIGKSDSHNCLISIIRVLQWIKTKSTKNDRSKSKLKSWKHDATIIQKKFWEQYCCRFFVNTVGPNEAGRAWWAGWLAGVALFRKRPIRNNQFNARGPMPNRMKIETKAANYFLNRHSSVVSSQPSILRPRVWIPTAPTTVASIYIVEIETVFVNGMRKGRK